MYYEFIPYVFLFLLSLFALLYLYGFPKIHHGEVIENLKNQYSSVIKIFIILILLKSILSIILLVQRNSPIWTPKVKEQMFSECILGLDSTYKNLGNGKNEFCECYVSNLTQDISYRELTKVQESSPEEFDSIVKSSFQPCLLVFKENLLKDWSEEDKQEIISTCLKNASTANKKYPDITKKYCECAASTIISTLSKVDYYTSISDSTKKEIYNKKIQKCNEVFKEEYNSIKNASLKDSL